MPKRVATGTNLGLSSILAGKRDRKSSKRGARPIQRACLDALETRTLMSTYFVSTTGADTAAGTLAQPLRTIQEAANVANWGDTVQIEGGTYHETVTPPHSGVTFTNYNNQTVIISGTDAVGGFANYSGSIYSTHLSGSLGEGNNQVFVDGQVLNEARWPNTSLNPSSPTKATIGSYSNSTIYDSALTQANGYWAGANINITPGDQWTTYTGTVTASGPGWITVALPGTGASEQPAAGNSFFLYGKFNALDTSAEFYVDSSNKLYLWDPSGDNPANHDVQVKDRLYGFDLSNVSNTTIQGVNLFACTINTGWGSSNTTINGITASYISQFMVVQNGWVPPTPAGIQLYGAGSILENSTISYSAGDGVFVDNNNITVKNNTIHDVDYSGTDSAGIRAYGSSLTITANTIYNSGRDGINFRGSYESILYNTVHDCMLQTSDGGGIYTASDWGGSSVIAYNAVYSINVASGYDGVGIYLDNSSSDFVVHDNVTANVQAGLKLNSTSYNETIYNNKIGASVNAIETNGWTGFAYDWSGSSVYNNTYYNPSVMLGANVAQWGNAYASGSPAIPAPATTTVKVASPPAPASPTPTSPPSPTSSPATSYFKATSYSQASNVGSSYGAVGYASNGSWVEYSSVDFGTGLTTFNANVAVANDYAGQKLEVFVDSLSGSPISVMTVGGTGGWSNFQWQSANVPASPTGVHNVYIEFVGSPAIANLMSWDFSGTPATASPASPPASPPPTVPTNPATNLWTAINTSSQSNVAPSYGAVGWDNNGSWVAYSNVYFAGGLSKFNANLAVTAQYAGQKLEVFVDSMNSAPVAVLTTTSTGAWNNFKWESTGMLSTVTGNHNVYIEFVGSYGIANLMNWQFT
jgi:hypothetical protein